MKISLLNNAYNQNQTAFGSINTSKELAEVISSRTGIKLIPTEFPANKRKVIQWLLPEEYENAKQAKVDFQIRAGYQIMSLLSHFQL